jgi:hypothetical protein
VTGNGIDDVAACGVCAKNPLDDGIVGLFKGAARFIFVIEGDDIRRALNCEVVSKGSCFDAGVPLRAEENGKVTG